MDVNEVKKLAGIPIVEETKEAIRGTNCSTCKYGTSKVKDVKPENLDAQGGTIPENEEQKKRAADADLITLPGKLIPKKKVWCGHKDVDQWVTEHMCCAFWDAPGTLRSYGEQKIGK